MCLSRKRDESIIIGDDVVIMILDIRGDVVRLGITAPIEVAIDRAEIRDAKDRERRKDGGA